MGMNAQTGEALNGIDHIRQSITDILGTPIGTRVMRREYGSIIPLLLDQPMNRSNLLRLYSAALVAISEWEPRVIVRSMNADLTNMNGGRIALSIDIATLEERSDFSIEISIGGSGG